MISSCKIRMNNMFLYAKSRGLHWSNTASFHYVAFFFTTLTSREIAYLALPAAGTDLLDKIILDRNSIVENFYVSISNFCTFRKLKRYLYLSSSNFCWPSIISNNKLDHPHHLHHHHHHPRINSLFITPWHTCYWTQEE